MKMNLDGPLVIHKGSLLAGAALVAVIGLALSAAQALPSNPRFLRIQLDPHPSTVVRVMEGTPYTVPAGAMLSLRVFGTNDVSGMPSYSLLKIDGVSVSSIIANPTYDTGFPIVAPAGAVVSMEEAYPSSATVYGLGYLTYI